MREGFRFDNLFKLNKKPPETGGQGGRLVYEEEKTMRHKSHQATAIVLVFLLGFIVTFGFVKKQAFIKEQPVIKLEKKADYILAEIAGLAKVDSTRAIELGLDLKRSVEDSRKNIGDKKNQKYYFVISSPDATSQETIDLFLIKPTSEVIEYTYDEETKQGGIPMVTFHKPESKWQTIKSVYLNLFSKL